LILIYGGLAVIAGAVSGMIALWLSSRKDTADTQSPIHPSTYPVDCNPSVSLEQGDIGIEPVNPRNLSPDEEVVELSHPKE